MRICNSCGRENPDDRDFCECGEYLRWDPTGVVQAITPEVLQAAQQQANTDAGVPAADAPAPAQPEAPAPGQATTEPPHPAAVPATPPAPASAPGNGQGAVVSGDPLAGAAPAPPPPPAAAAPHPVPTAPQPAVPAAPVTPPPPAAPAQPAEPDPAAISLRLPEGEQVNLGETLAVGVEPGQRARVLALVRNQSGIVDNYELSVRGLPNDWWSIYPNTVYLVPFGSERHVRAGSGDPLPPAALRRGRVAHLGARGRRRVEGLQPPGRRRPAASRHPAVRGVQDQALARARLRPQEGAVRRRGQEHRQRAGHRRARRRRHGQRARLQVHAGDDGDPAGPVDHLEDAGQAAPQALDRAPGGEADPGLHQDGRGGQPGQVRRGHGAARGRGRRGRGGAGPSRSARASSSASASRARAPRSAPAASASPARAWPSRGSRARTST